MSVFSNLRRDLYAALLEFIGTILFLTLGLGGIQAAAFSNQAAATTGNAVSTVASISQLMYIAVSMGLALIASAWLFFRITGGLFNPSVSLALFLVGGIGPLRFMLYVIAQLAGGIAATAILLVLLPGPLAFSCAPGPGVSLAQATIIEMFLTAALVFAVLMLAAEKHKSTALAPIGIGLTLFVGHLWGVIYTGASMNTARAFGPAVFIGFIHSHWVYWVGPLSGSLVATGCVAFITVCYLLYIADSRSGLYAMLKHINYVTLNPDQDTMDEKNSPPNPMPAFKRSMSNVGRAPGQLARVLSHTRSISSTAGEPLRPAMERGETLRWDEPSNLPPV